MLCVIDARMAIKRKRTTMTNDADLCFMSALEHKRLLQSREVSAVELLDAQLAQIEQSNPSVNAIVTLTADRARSDAAASDARRANGEPLGVLDGVKMSTYVDWGALRHVVSLLGLPSLSVPCGFTADGLPVGLQITGRHHADFAVLQLGHAFEQATSYWRRRPA